MASSTPISTMIAAAASGAELLLLGVRDPGEDLQGQSRELAEEAVCGVGREGRTADHDQRRRLADRARQRQDRPVAMPGIAAGSTCFQIVCHWVAPSAIEPSRIDGGTARSASRPAMITTGSTSSPRVSPPAAPRGRG